ncbi:anti-sigma-E factor ChrR [Marinobacterium zhoushanense]|uniref:Anti-sigma-E factor ChrR n=1 Tax=Marinobacterium zhoushanense TaxID=1679163 RepID=A0ABQ1KEH8_9GAMM|nr:ChrR family anti-sigma-E factor [Marinobacterium zhoushanense]GGB91810.1 anti-sigma-E factor ChrR [Marinobacterium zhoushanense]
MTTIRHHLDDATLVSYTSGALTNSMALVVACHLSVCGECRKRCGEMEVLGGEMLERLQPVDLSDAALQNLLDALDGEEASEPTPKAPSPPPADVPAPLWPYIDKPLDELAWKSLAPGFAYVDLPCQGTGASKLLRIAPGKSVLPHTHTGNELTMVLRGSFVDEVGRFASGDIADIDDAIEHQPLVDSPETCICLIATDGPLRFTSLLGRIVQPLTGF